MTPKQSLYVAIIRKNVRACFDLRHFQYRIGVNISVCETVFLVKRYDAQRLGNWALEHSKWL